MTPITKLTVEMFDGTLATHDFPEPVTREVARAKAHDAYKNIPAARTIALWSHGDILEFVVQSTDGRIG